jgi:hypothetical protein
LRKIRHKIRLKLILIRFKNNQLRIIDDILRIIKPPRLYKGIPRKILIFRNDRIGDAVVTLPFLRDLKLNFPETEIHILAYDLVFDLVGYRRLAVLSRMISGYSIGSRLFLMSWLYSYYLRTHWVSQQDDDFMTRKTEKTFTEAISMKFIKRNTNLPFKGIKKISENKYDIFIHLGTSVLRKINFETEKELVRKLSDLNIIITDIEMSERYLFYKNLYSEYSNIKFILYPHLNDIIKDVSSSALLLCYDGGQAHFLSQFVKTFVIFGPGSVPLWKPYEFKSYSILKEWENGVRAIKSTGNYGHMVIHYPIWCSPCFDIGCDTKPCLNNINADMLYEIIGYMLTEKNN